MMKSRNKVGIILNTGLAPNCIFLSTKMLSNDVSINTVMKIKQQGSF